MEQKIFDFCEEKFRYELPKVQFSTECLDLKKRTGAEATGSFRLFLEEGRGREGERIRGYFTCENSLIEIFPMTVDVESAEITVRADASYLLSGEVREGSLFFISDHGEYEIPYRLAAEERSLRLGELRVESLEEFVALAKENFQAAVKLFFMDSFEEVLLKGYGRERVVRKGLLFSGDKFQALEEFLCFLRKKERVVCRAEKTRYEFHVTGKPMQYKLRLHKNTWGYFRAKVLVEGGFIRLNKEEITEKDFVENECVLDLYVDSAEMTGMKRLSKVRVLGLQNEIEIEVHLINVAGTRLSLGGKRKRQEGIENAIKAYYNYRMKSISLKELTKILRATLYEDKKERRGEEVSYIGAYLDYLNGNEGDARKVLEENKRWEKTPLAGAMETYLEYLMAGEGQKNGFQKKMEDFAENYGVMEAYFFIMNMEERFETNLANKVELLAKLYQAGMNRSFLFLETWLVFEKEAELVTRLDGLTIRAFSRAIRFGYKIKKELVEKFAYLAGKLREYHPIVMGILKEMYEREKSEEVLAAICSLLLKADKVFSDTGYWVKLGIKEGIKVTGIYELYMETLGKEDKIPSSVFVYFLYGNSLSREKKARMYAYLLRYKEEKELQEFYEKYREQIREFSIKELERGEMSENHIFLYKEGMKEREFVERVVHFLPNLVYKAEVKVENKNYSSIAVVHKELKKPILYSISSGRGYPDMLVGSSYFFSDGEGRLYLPEEEVFGRQLFEYDRYLEMLRREGEENIFTSLALLRKHENGRGEIISELANILLPLEEIEEETKLKLRKSLLRYYEEKSDFLRFEETLRDIPLKQLGEEDRREIAEPVLRNHIKGFGKEVIQLCGVNQIRIETLADFVKKSLSEAVEKEEEGVLLEAGLRLFREEKGFDTLYAWMADRLEAPVSVLLSLFRKLTGKEFLNVAFTEKIMEQMLFTETVTEETEDVYLYYDKTMNKILEKAYLNYKSYLWLLKEVSLGDFVAKKLAGEALKTKSVLSVMAYLKFLSKKEELSSEEKEFSAVRLLKFVEEGMILPFFKDFKGKCKIPAEIENLFFVSQNGDREDEISINYVIRLQGEGGESYVSEWMKNVYMGIFVKEFLIFADERVKYFVSKQENGKEEILKSDEIAIELSDLIEEDENVSLYAKMNHIVLARNLEDEKTVEEYMRNYIIQKEVVGKIFDIQAIDEDIR